MTNVRGWRRPFASTVTGHTEKPEGTGTVSIEPSLAPCSARWTTLRSTAPRAMAAKVEAIPAGQIQAPNDQRRPTKGAADV